MSQKPKRGSQLAVWIAVGSGIGTALGVALDNIAMGVAVGVGVGVAIGSASNAKTHGKSTRPIHFLFLGGLLALALLIAVGAFIIAK